MTPTLSPPLNRACALAILAGLVGGAYFGIAAPLIASYEESADEIDRLRAALVRYERAGRDIEQRKAELAALKHRDESADGFLRGGSEALIAAEVQNRIKALIDAGKGELKSTQILPPQEEGRFRRIAVRAQMSSKLAALQSVVYGLEGGSPLLFLDNVEIRGLAERKSDDASDDPTLDVRFDVYGYTRGAK